MSRHAETRFITEAHEAWDLALAERAEHELACTECVPFSLTDVCPEGRRLADVEQAAWRAWSRRRLLQVVAS